METTFVILLAFGLLLFFMWRKYRKTSDQFREITRNHGQSNQQDTPKEDLQQASENAEQRVHQHSGCCH